MNSFSKIFILLLLSIITSSCTNKLFDHYKINGKKYQKINISKIEEYASQKNNQFERNSGYSNVNRSTEGYILTSKKDSTMRIIVQKLDGQYTYLQKVTVEKGIGKSTHFYPNGDFKSMIISTKDNPYTFPEIIQNISLEIAPDFQMKNINGEYISITDFRGYYVYINVWTTWSRRSEKEIVAFNSLVEKFGGENIVFINVSIDSSKDWTTWITRINEKKMNGIQLFADNGWDSDFVKEYRVDVPHSILIDPSGIILNSVAPYPSNPAINEILSKIYNYGK
jgi:peroxiredoxin